MISNIANISDITFPVYLIGSRRPESSDGVLFYANFYENEDTGESKETIRILDDKNIELDSLAKRRLRLAADEVPLVALGKGIFFYGDLIKLANSVIWFIDSKGLYFQYRKSTRTKLRFHKISKLIPIPAGGVIIELEDYMTRFKMMYTPASNVQYAGVIHLGKSLILYGVYDEKYDDTWRTI